MEKVEDPGKIWDCSIKALYHIVGKVEDAGKIWDCSIKALYHQLTLCVNDDFAIFRINRNSGEDDNITGVVAYITAVNFSAGFRPNCG